MIPQETVESIFNTARVEEVVGDFVNLKRRGANYIGLCPFHNEKTPSFSVSPAKGSYKCFGCGKGGNSVKFIMDHERMNYEGALRYLARKYNIEIVEEEKTQKVIQEGQARESLMVLTHFAQKFFSDNLETEQGKAIGLSYLEERGLSPETIEKFKLGYAPENPKAFMNAALHAGYKLKYLVEAGLVGFYQKEGEEPREPSPERCYDRFAGRVIFPILDISGRVIAFGGRTLKKDKTVAKYVNSPESPIYHKSNVLYGLNFARRAIIAEDKCVLVEGYLDVISMHQAGIENVVASAGTSLTTEQIKLIQRNSPNLTILYDGDEAGLKATQRGVALALKEGIDVKLVTLPPEDDPDTFVRKNSIEEVKKYLKNNEVDPLFQKMRLFKDASDPNEKKKFHENIIELIAHISQPVKRNTYIKEYCRAFGVEEESLRRELSQIFSELDQRRQREEDIKKIENKQVDRNFFDGVVEQPKPIVSNLTSEYQEKELMRVLLKYGNQETSFIIDPIEGEEPTITSMKVADYIIQSMKADDIVPEIQVYFKIYEEYCLLYERGDKVTEEYFLKHPDPLINQVALEMFDDTYRMHDWSRRNIGMKMETDHLGLTVEKAVFGFKSLKVELMIKDLQENILLPLNEEELGNMLINKQRLDSAKKMLKKKLGRVI
jgi:DNA primase